MIVSGPTRVARDVAATAVWFEYRRGYCTLLSRTVTVVPHMMGPRDSGCDNDRGPDPVYSVAASGPSRPVDFLVGLLVLISIYYAPGLCGFLLVHD